jgi:hypothetical protein
MSLASIARASKKLGDGISLLESTYLRVETRGKVVEAAVIDGYQNTPASRYHEGVDVAVMRYHSQALGIPDGVYRLRVKSARKITRRGRHRGESQLFNSDNQMVFSMPHYFDVTSVELPRVAGSHDVVIRVNNFAENLNSHSFNDHLEFTVDYCCTNGVCGTCIGSGCPVER